MNELHAELAPSGLTIVGVTDEDPEPTMKFVAATKAAYAIAYDEGGALSRRYGVDGIPEALLFDATGALLWRGHPNGLRADQVAQALEAALPEPLFEWPAEAKAVADALRARRFADALAATDAMGDAGARYRGWIEKLADARVARVERVRAAGDRTSFDDLRTRFGEELAGTPAGERLAEVVARGIGAEK